MSVSVKENRPGSAAIDSHPHAAIVSVTARPEIGAALAAEQQSSRRRTSDLDFSNTTWMADHSRVAYVKSRLLFHISYTCCDEQAGGSKLPGPCRLSSPVNCCMATIIDDE